MNIRLIIALTAAVAAAGASAAPGERNCGIWLDNVPAVTDSATNRIYFSLKADQPALLNGSLRWDSKLINVVELDGKALGEGVNFNIPDWHTRGAHSLVVNDAAGVCRQWSIEFTNLPLILVEADQASLFETWKNDSDYKTPTYITVIDPNCRTFESHEDENGIDINSDPMVVFNSTAAVRVRGVTSAGKEKKPFAIELRDQAGEERNMHLLGYRNDGDWILDAMFNDRLRMRNRLIFDIWNSVQDLPYAKDNDYQRNGTDGEFVEVFLRGRYWGLYCFTDKIDRKKLNLKKTQNEGTTAETKRGMLWKSLFRCDATTFTSYTENPLPGSLFWEKTDKDITFEQKYPDTRPDQGDFTPIAEMIDCVGAKASESLFAQSYSTKFYLSNLIDYHIFTQALQLQDNLQKNMYLSVRNVTKDKTLLITPWDLDASLGRDAGGDPINQNDSWMAFGEHLGGINFLLHRLCYDSQAAPYRQQLFNRWEELKQGELAIDRIRQRMLAYADLFTTSGAYQREYELWKRKMDDDIYHEIDFVTEFLTANYAKFDQTMRAWGFSPENPGPGPEPQNPEAVTISDIISLPEGEGNCLQIVMLDGYKAYFMFDSNPVITFNDSDIVVTSADNNCSWQLGDVDYFSFIKVDNPTNGINYITPPELVDPQGNSSRRVYTIDGIEVNPSSLRPGFYILKIGNRAIKFRKN